MSEERKSPYLITINFNLWPFTITINKQVQGRIVQGLLVLGITPNFYARNEEKKMEEV